MAAATKTIELHPSGPPRRLARPDGFKTASISVGFGGDAIRLLTTEGQALTESLVLSLVGALLGLAFSYWGSRMLVAFMTEGTVSFDLRPDLRVLSVVLFVGVSTGILFGLAPTWHSSRLDPAIVLQQGSRVVAPQ